MWIPSKLTRPGRLHNAILRPRVLDLVNQASHYKLVLFRSPAGYGKTTMAAQWLADCPNLGWLSLDDSDNDTVRFMNYFIQALNRATHGACPTAQSLAEKRQFSSVMSLMGEIFGELGQYHEEAFVVLDDYHIINNEEIHEGLRFFLKHMPDNITVVVTSRANPPLGIANLRVRDLMIEINDQLLAFDTEETTRFLSSRTGNDIDSDTANNLRGYVEGWPSALQLIAIQAQQQNISLAQSAESMADFNHAHLWEYLVEEVFDFLDEKTQLFLLQCSVLETFNDALVSQVTNRDDALSALENLNRFGLFVTMIEGEQNWYRFHRLFNDFLGHERLARIPQQEQMLHQRAAEAWLNLNSPSQALYHAQKAKDSELCVTILVKHGWTMFNMAEFAVMEQAIQELSDDELYSNPKIPLLRAWVAQTQHRYNVVEELLTEAAKQLEERNIPISESEMGQVNALLAQVAINFGKPEKALQLAELALSQIDNNDSRSRIFATSVIGEVNHVLGRLNRALPMMQQTEKLARQYRVFNQALWALLQQSEILIAQGYVQAAYEVQDSAFKLIEEQQLHQLPLHEFLLRIRSQVLWCWNRFDEAEEYAYRGIDVLGEKAASKHLHCYSMLARIAIGRGELDRAGRFVEHIQQLLNESTYHIDWSANASLTLILFWQAKEQHDDMQKWLDNAERPEIAPNHFMQLQWRNIARAQIYLGQLEAAKQSVAFLVEQADSHELLTDRNRNLIVQALLADALGQEEGAMNLMLQAIKLTNQTGMVANFLIEGAIAGRLLEKLIQRGDLGDLEKHRAQSLIKEISSKQRSRFVHFDEEFVERLVNHPNIPELVRTSPLTQREWQVLGLIYSGYSNEQIAHELDVAGTTIKTHIRNLYQKLNIANRKEAIETAERLMSLMGM
ncbi:HTH-type transcriptional regulator MalT [Vibrio ulleungensis]|uniref:HTH-type transcriptional regulator MalT n=1 Tax=Vibrio ulleungensis TaxID=2807619 RepID=A0ABS2HBY5_9VIBR|nr:HTH-type transcriptional regulator MalT [Vibrio ulleungensis]MBM7035110.1 HTH-type transcriptional regulator MalT [Vibrio ulleungensis]